LLLWNFRDSFCSMLILISSTEEQRSTTTQISTLQSTLSTHGQILSRESSEKNEMLSQITSLEFHQSSQQAQRDRLKNAIAHTQRQIDAKLAAQREYAAKVDSQSRMNGPELNFWETYLGCRFEGCRFDGRGDEDGIRVIFNFEPVKQGPNKGQEREGMFEMKLPSGPGGRYDVAYSKPRLQEEKVKMVVERMNESREIATLLKGMRGLFVEEMQ
jgi:kinetochore protein Spc25, fungi type